VIRGITAAMFYYHPYAYFSKENIRARVVNWLPDPYFKITNEDRVRRILLKEIERKTGKRPKKIKFIYPLKIEYEPAPLFFYCANCGWTTKFNDSQELRRFLERGGELKCKKCGGKMIQSGHVFVCPCGRIDEIDLQRHCGENMKLVKPSLYDVGTWHFTCMKCGERRDLVKFCPNCGSRMTLKPCDASGVTIPLGKTIPSYGEEKLEWIQEYFNWESEIDKEKLREAGLSEQEINLIVRNRTKDFVSKKLSLLSENKYEQEFIKERILGFMSIKSHVIAENHVDPKYGIEKVCLVDDIKLVQCVYGYVVGTYDFNEVKEKDGFCFFRDGEFYQILSREISTEGILIILDKHQVVRWLMHNDFIREPPPAESLNEWFVKIAITENSIYQKVKELVHTISHALIKIAPIFCGINTNSIREFLLAEIPAVLIYNTTNSTLGSMHTLFETRLEDWFYAAEDVVENCIHDPVCISEESGAACIGCIVLSEVSCEEFNLHLNRRTLIGGKGEIGYWVNR